MVSRKNKVVMTLELLNKFSGTLAEYEKELAKAQQATKKHGQGISKSWKLSMTEINQGAELAKKAFRGMQVVFDSAKMGAKFRAQSIAFNRMASSMGADANKILADMQAAAKGTVSTADAVAAGARSLALGLQPEKLADLMKIARSASIQMGTDATTAFNDLTLAVGRQSKMILDNLGIVISQEAANKRYAAEMKIVGRELTDVERKQAFLNEAVRVGAENMQKAGEMALTDAERLASFEAAIKDAKVAVGEMLAQLFADWFLDVAKAVPKATEKLKEFFDTVVAGKAQTFKSRLEEVRGEIAALESNMGKGGFFRAASQNKEALAALKAEEAQLLKLVKAREETETILKEQKEKQLVAIKKAKDEETERLALEEQATEQLKASIRARQEWGMAAGKAYDEAEDGAQDLSLAEIEAAKRAAKEQTRIRKTFTEEELSRWSAMADEMEADYVETAEVSSFRAAEIRAEVDKKAADNFKKTWRGAWEESTKDYIKASKDWAAHSRELFSIMSSNMENLFFNVFKGRLESIKDVWENIWKQMVDFALRLLAKIATAKILPQLAGALGIPGLAGAAQTGGGALIGAGVAGGSSAVGGALFGPGAVFAPAGLQGPPTAAAAGLAKFAAGLSAALPVIAGIAALGVGVFALSSILGGGTSGQTQLEKDFDKRFSGFGIGAGTGTGHDIVRSQGADAFFQSLTDEWKKVFAGDIRQGVINQVLPEIAATFGTDSDIANVVFENLEKWASDVGLAGEDFAEIMSSQSLTFEQKMEALQLAAQGLAWTQTIAARNIGEATGGIAESLRDLGVDLRNWNPSADPLENGGDEVPSVRTEGGGGGNLIVNVPLTGVIGDDHAVSRNVARRVKEVLGNRQITF